MTAAGNECAHGQLRRQCQLCELEAEVARLREWILEHGEHAGKCGALSLDGDGNHCACDCGLADILRGAGK